MGQNHIPEQILYALIKLKGQSFPAETKGAPYGAVALDDYQSKATAPTYIPTIISKAFLYSAIRSYLPSSEAHEMLILRSV